MSKQKLRELTDMQQKFLDCLFDEAKGDLHKAKDLAGYAKSVSVWDIVKSLSDEIRELATKRLTVESVKAVFAMTEAMENGSSLGAANKIKAASQILDRANIQKKDDTEVKTNGPTVVIVLPEKKVSIDED